MNSSFTPACHHSIVRQKMKRRHKAIIALLALPFAAFLVLATFFNEAFNIKRAYPKAHVSASHRFGPVLSLWDLFGALVPGDYIAPVDHANIAIQASEKPVDIAKLLGFRVGYIQIFDSEIENFDGLLTGHKPNIPINLVNPTFLGASPEELLILDKHKVYDEVSNRYVYWFGSV